MVIIKENFYLLIIVGIASFIGWAFLTFLRPTIIESGCSEIAEKSNNRILSEEKVLDSKYSFENIYARCLEDAKISAKR